MLAVAITALFLASAYSEYIQSRQRGSWMTKSRTRSLKGKGEVRRHLLTSLESMQKHSLRARVPKYILINALTFPKVQTWSEGRLHTLYRIIVIMSELMYWNMHWRVLLHIKGRILYHMTVIDIAAVTIQPNQRL